MLQQNLTIPEDHYAACAARDPPIPTAGNAAANTQNMLDLTGANVSPPPLPSGFEAKGIVALTFSILAGLIGCGVVTWYGLGEMGEISREKQRARIDHTAQERGVLSRSNTDADAGVAGATSHAKSGDQITTVAQ